MKIRNVLIIAILGISIVANAYFLIRHFRATHVARNQKAFYQPSIQGFDSVFYSEECIRFSKLPNSTCRLIFMGDSIPTALVANLEDKKNEGDLDESWESLLNGGFRNRCISGATTVGIDQMLDKITLPQTEKVFLWLGINDLSMKRTVPDVESNYLEILTKLRRAEPKAHIVIISLLPVSNGQDINASIVALNLRLTSLAASIGAEFIDVRPAVIDAQGNRDPASTYDGVHPTASALTRIEKIIAGVSGQK